MNGAIVDEKASKVGPAGIDIAYQRFGNPEELVADRKLVRIMVGGKGAGVRCEGAKTLAHFFFLWKS